jgi:hypothetical protein
MDLASFIGLRGSYPTVGLEAVERARKAGLSNEEIKQKALEESLNFGVKAKETLTIENRKSVEHT